MFRDIRHLGLTGGVGVGLLAICIKKPSHDLPLTEAHPSSLTALSTNLEEIITFGR
jgi:hypothetical protein